MSWRKHDTHKAETQAVKTALQAAGFQAVKVGYWTGTAWAWLKVEVEIPITEHFRCNPNQFQQMHCSGNCPGCEALRQAQSRVYAIIRDVTGRSGEYNGQTNLSVAERSQ